MYTEKGNVAKRELANQCERYTYICMCMFLFIEYSDFLEM